jgi:hypothetical protein
MVIAVVRVIDAVAAASSAASGKNGRNHGHSKQKSADEPVTLSHVFVLLGILVKYGLYEFD